MSKKNNKPKDFDMVHFKACEETVIRADETQKNEYFSKKKKEKSAKAFKIIVCIISVITLLVSSTFLAKRGIEKYIVLPKENTKYKLPEDVVEELDDLSDEDAWAYLYKQYPDLMNVEFPPGINYEYALQYAQNPQMFGYIKIEGTKVDYPVAQAQNNKYYLNHDFYGSSTSYGAIFASHIDSINPLPRNTLLYGHNMKDGARFAAITNYKSLEYFKEHPVIEFNTLYEKHKWKVYAAIITNGNIDGDDGYFFDFTFDNCSDTCYAEFIEEVDKRKLYNTGVDLTTDDKIITLCTCSYEFDNARLIVIARMVREGEDENVDTSLASYKSTPVKYPAAYYSNPSKNPYKDDKKWYLY